MDCSKASRVLPSCFAKTVSNTDLDSERSEAIDRQLERDKSTYDRTFQVFLTGGDKSGKSTLLTKLRQLHGEQFSSNMKMQRDSIRKYVVHFMVHTLTEMKKSSPPVRLSSLKNEAAARIILEVVKKPNFRYFDEFSTCSNVPDFVNLPNLIKMLWCDPGLFEAMDGVTYYIAEHFFNRIDEISEESYIPSSEDNYLCPISSTINIDEFFLEGTMINFRFFDVNNRLTPMVRRTLMKHLEFKRLITVFVVDCSSYDIVIFNESLYTNLHKDLELSAHMMSSHLFHKSTFFILLNKYHVFKKKILSGKRLEDYFPEYKRFTCMLRESNESTEVLRATHFIKNMITELAELLDSRLWPPYPICDFNTLNEDDIRLFLNELTQTTITGDILPRLSLV